MVLGFSVEKMVRGMSEGSHASAIKRETAVVTI